MGESALDQIIRPGRTDEENREIKTGRQVTEGDKTKADKTKAEDNEKKSTDTKSKTQKDNKPQEETIDNEANKLTDSKSKTQKDNKITEDIDNKIGGYKSSYAARAMKNNVMPVRLCYKNKYRHFRKDF